MSALAVVATVAGLVAFFIIAELAAAVLPILIIVAFVPPEERRGLAELMAAADSSSRLRLWTALRVAVTARRRERVSGRSPGSPRR
jgi:hypothetical protein